MIAKIAQIKANGENRFEISNEFGVLFYASTPWLDIKLPFNAENIRKLSMTDCSGEEIFTTSYSIIENAIEEALPFKYLWAGQQQFAKYSLDGKNGREGSFYSRKDGFLDEKYCIEKDGRIILGYSIGKGTVEVISFYENEQQIAQITKPLSEENNLDLYYLHLADDKDDLLGILAFFTIYYDFRRYHNNGQFVSGKKRVSIEYTYSKNNKYYNQNWIKQQFGSLEAERFQNELERHRKESKQSIKKAFMIFGIVFISLLATFVLSFFILSKTVLKPKTPLDVDAFTEKLEMYDFTVEEIQEGSMRAYNQNFELYFYIFDTEEDAKANYNKVKESFEGKINGNYSMVSGLGSYRLKTKTHFYFASCVENTLLVTAAPVKYAEEVKDIQEVLDY